MTLKVIVEFQAKPGARAKLAGILQGISAAHGPSIPGFLGSIVHEVVDNPDGLVEIAEWDSAEVQAAAVEQAMASGLYAPVIELVAAPFKSPGSPSFTNLGGPAPPREAFAAGSS